MLPLGSGLLADSTPRVHLLKNNALEIEGQKMILFGVAIPTATEKCFSEDKQWPCGASATLRLSAIFNDTPFTCVQQSNDSNTPLVKCSNSSFDIAEQLVLEGWALSVIGSEEYAVQENIAASQLAGIWKSGFSPPDDWRTYPDLDFDPIQDLQCSVCAIRKQ